MVNRYLSQKAASEPWPVAHRSERHTCVRSWMPGQHRHPFSVVFEKGAQIGATESGLNWIGYAIHQAPGRCCPWQPTVDMAKRYSKQRIAPMIEESSALRDLVADTRSRRQRQHGSREKSFAGGVLVMTGGEQRGRASVHACAITCSWTRWMATRATSTAKATRSHWPKQNATFPTAQDFHASQRRRSQAAPESTGSSRSRISVSSFAVPHCDHYQTLKFAQLEMAQGEPGASNVLVCRIAALRLASSTRPKCRRGEWRATAEGDGRTVGFHLSGHVQPGGLGCRGLRSRNAGSGAGDPELLKEFINTVLARGLAGRRATLPSGTSFTTAAKRI